MSEADFQGRLRSTFRVEAREHWQALASALYELERAEDSAGKRPIVENMFRGAHTLKGAARLVGEHDVESISARLEEVFSALKQRGAAPDAVELRELHEQVAELQRALGITDPLEASPAAEPTREEVTPPPVENGEAAASVRVPTARLESMLRQAEELLALKTIGAERTDALLELRARMDTWSKRWARLKPQLVTLRREVDQATGAPSERALRDVLQYLEWNEEFIHGLRDEVLASGQAATREQAWLGGLVDGLLEDTKEVLVLPCSSLLEVFPNFVRQAAQQEGKQIRLVLEGADTEVDRRVLDEIRDALTHLVRNSVDHGLEPPDERLIAGKSAEGTLTLAITEKAGGSVELSVSDDGRGVDLAQVRSVAVKRGLATAEEMREWPEAEVVGLLFESGFSTRTEVSGLSGRGLGLSIVKEKAERLGGSVAIESRPGRGTTFRLLLPITLARFRGVFVTAGQRRFVLPATYVRQVVRLSADRVRTVKNQPTLQFEGHTLPLLNLADVLRVPNAPGGGPAGFGLIISSGRAQIACKVDEIPYESEIVMKPLGPLLPRVRNLAGATIVGAGQVVPVLSATDLIRAATERVASGRTPVAAAAAPARRSRILIAEDSITSRSLFKNILQGAGFEVVAAVDGIEAITALQYERFDLVISDVQMPRMDGFELTRKIRTEPKLSTLPVILITSLASREDRERGVDAGANAYVVKSSFDQSDLLQTIRRLLP